MFFELRKVIVGQSRLIERMLVGLLSQGHCLLESVPGLAKTLAAETLSKVVGGTFGRVQFTPDLLPSDIVGTRIFRSSSEKFDVELGPVFVNFLLADEINRAPAKVQSALLEVMAEQHVTIGGNTYDVPMPFFVIATQNPIESEGVYHLPEAQRDRFMMKITMTHPSADEEMTIVDRMSVSPPVAEQVIDLQGLAELQRRAAGVFIDRSVQQYAVDLVQATRTPAQAGMADLAPVIALGASPRATLALVRGAKALALAPRPHLRHTAGDLRPRARGVAPPVDPHLRRPVPRHLHRTRSQPGAQHGADDVGVAEAEQRRVAATGPQPPCRRTEMSASSTIEWPSGPTPASIAELLRSLEFTINRRLDGQLHGQHQGITPGHGSEPGESRTYQPGDDVRRIDWNVTARTRELHVRDQIADRDLEAWMVVDVSAAMHFGTLRSTKAQIALAAAATVGFLTARNQNRLGAVSGRRTTPAHHTAATRPRQRAGDPAGSCRFARHRRARTRRHLRGDASRRRLSKRRGFVCVISDFAGRGLVVADVHAGDAP